MDLFTICLAKETFKFSSTHFTLFSETSAERLHGHNYQVAVECEVSALGSFGMAFEFNTLKPLVKSLTETWDEMVLLPTRSSHLKFSDELVGDEPHINVQFQERSYRFPKSDVVLLPIENVTSEELARHFAMALATAWRSRAEGGLSSRVGRLKVRVEETRGQSATFSLLKPLQAVKT